jgi:hypothetical protein
MSYLHDLDLTAQNDALSAYVDQAQNAIKNPEHLAKLTEARDLFNTALQTGTGTVGGLISHKALAGLKKKAFDPLFKRGKALAEQTKDAVGERLNQLTGEGDRLLNKIQPRGDDGDPFSGLTDEDVADLFESDLPSAAAPSGGASLVQNAAADGGAAARDLLSADQYADSLGLPSVPGAAAAAPADIQPLADADADRMGLPRGSSLVRGAPTDEPDLPKPGDAILDEDPFSAPRSLGTTTFQRAPDPPSFDATPSDPVGDGISQSTGGAADEATEAATGAGESIGEDVVGGLSAAVGTDAAAGGPLDIFGDIAALAVGLGTVFAGVYGAKKPPMPEHVPIVNPSVQKGLGGF